VTMALKVKLRQERQDMLLRQRQPTNAPEIEVYSAAEKKRVWKGQNGQFNKDLLRAWHKIIPSS
jgi:hypothetical protein